VPAAAAAGVGQAAAAAPGAPALSDASLSELVMLVSVPALGAAAVTSAGAATVGAETEVASAVAAVSADIETVSVVVTVGAVIDGVSAVLPTTTVSTAGAGAATSVDCGAETSSAGPDETVVSALGSVAENHE
jgi:hypothetical protein